MQAAGYIRNSGSYGNDRSFVVGISLMALAVTITLFAFLFSSGSFESYPYLFLVPWLLGLGIVMAIPMVFLYYKGRFTLVDPLVFGTLSYFFPAFVVGGLFFATGLSQPSFTSFIQDAHYTLPLTVCLVALGFSGLAAGYLLPIGSKLGALLAPRLPAADYSPNALIFPGMLLLLSGVMNTGIALILGQFGYQKANEINSYDGLIHLTTLFWVQASFLLWSIIFRQKKWNILILPILFLLLATSLTKFLYMGNRGNVIQIFVVITFAFILSGRRFSIKQGVVAGTLLTLGLTIGMIYGTTFRHVKGTEESQSAEKYTENVFQAIDEVGKSDVYDSLAFGAVNFTERVDVLSTLAVVVSNYEQLKPYEEAYGLDDNIWAETTTFMIPRIIWPDKPVISDARKYSDLYFDFGGSSYAITPMGDLLRNYGIVGIPIGMFIIGIILRFIYRSLVENQPGVLWRLTLYFMLVTSVSYEGFYGTIIPLFVKIGLISVIGVVIVSLIAKKIDQAGLAART